MPTNSNHPFTFQHRWSLASTPDMRLEKHNLRAWNTLRQCALTVHSPAVPFLKERFHRRYMITIRQDMVTGWTQLLAESGNVKQRPIVVDLNPEEMYDLVKEGEGKLTWDIEIGGARSAGDGRNDARYIDEQIALNALAIDVATFR